MQGLALVSKPRPIVKRQFMPALLLRIEQLSGGALEIQQGALCRLEYQGLIETGGGSRRATGRPRSIGRTVLVGLVVMTVLGLAAWGPSIRALRIRPREALQGGG